MQPSATAAPVSKSSQKFYISALNGTVCFTLAYLLVNGLYQLATVLMAERLRVRGSWGPSTVSFSLADNEWWRLGVVAVYGIGPLVVAGLGLLAYQWYWQRQRAQRGLLKLLLLWVALHAVNAVLGGLVADTFLRTGFYYVPAWLLGLGTVVNVVLAVVAGLAQVVVGSWAAVAFLQAHDSRTVMRYEYRQRMVVSTIVLPWLLGAALLALVKAPRFSLQEGLHLAALLLLLLPMAVGCLNELFGATVRSPQGTGGAGGLLALGALLLLGWRRLLSPPRVFGI